MRTDEYTAIEKTLVYVKWAKWYGWAVSRKILHSRWLYFIFTDASPDGWVLATDNEIDFLD